MRLSEAEYVALLARRADPAPRRRRPVRTPEALALPPTPRYRSKTEQRFAETVLAPHHHAAGGFWQYEPFRLHLAPRTTYTPDFLSASPDGKALTCYEVKGAYIRDRATDKLKMAAVQFWWMRFVLAQWTVQEWVYRVIPAA